MNTYIENVKRSIKRNMILAQEHDGYDPYKFIDKVDDYIQKLWNKGGPTKKKSKTRHG